MSEPSLLTGWLAGELCCQPRFQFHEVKAVKVRGENCKGGCTPTFLPLSISQAMESGEVDGWHTSVLTLVNADVYVKKYENEDAEVQTTYT